MCLTFYQFPQGRGLQRNTFLEQQGEAVNVSGNLGAMREWNRYPNPRRKAEARGKTVLEKFHKYQQSQPGYTLNV